MSEHTIYTRASRAAIRDAIARIPEAACSGGVTANAMMTRVGITLLGRIKQAFIVKARGGTDEAGERWQPLKASTIAYSRTRQRGRGGRTKAEKGRSARPSQALNAKQQERWWTVYKQGLAMFKGNKASAAKRAWAILKSEGATTLVSKYGGRQVEILRDTGLLLNSLSPGVASSEQVFRVGRGEIVVGTNRKWAKAHHEGIPGRLPRRRLWPEPRKWPTSWWLDLTEQAQAGLVDITMQMIREIR